MKLPFPFRQERQLTDLIAGDGRSETEVGER